MTNIGSSTGTPRKEYFVREDKDDSLFGPLDFRVADKHARHLSENNDSGLAEVVTRVGDRPGDPARVPDTVKVVFLYVRGKKTLGGRSAQYHSDNNLPPTV